MKKLALFLMASLAINAGATVKPASLIGDNMVLQQNTDARLWGKANPNATVTVTPSWDNQTYTTKADANGAWKVAVKTPSASYTPYTITISDGDDLTLNNVLVGEVWLASGQSNMEMPLKGFDGCCVLGGFDEIATAATRADKIRFFNVPKEQSYEICEDVNSHWDIPSPATAQDFSATAWYYAKRLNDVLDVPIGVVSAAYGGARVESWTPREILETYEDVSLDPKDIESMTQYLRPMLMYNAMFCPIKDYTYNGIIWYQGCSNVGAHDTYPERLATMVSHWRDQIGLGDIPFYAVEIAPYQYGPDPEGTGAAPYLREAQWKATKLIPNSDMISINDLVSPYERYNIHPENKEAVGKRLGDLALNKTYGHNEFRAGSPAYKSHKIEDGKVLLTIDAPTGGICRNYDIQGFEIAGADKVFYPVKDIYYDWRNNVFYLSCPEVPQPEAVRYCFKDFQIGTMYGGNYLPLIPFRSDNW